MRNESKNTEVAAVVSAQVSMKLEGGLMVPGVELTKTPLLITKETTDPRRSIKLGEVTYTWEVGDQAMPTRLKVEDINRVRAWLLGRSSSVLSRMGFPVTGI